MLTKLTRSLRKSLLKVIDSTDHHNTVKNYPPIKKKKFMDRSKYELTFLF